LRERLLLEAKKPAGRFVRRLLVLQSRSDWHSFEPAVAMVEAYTAAFLQPFDPHLQMAATGATEFINPG
jgi:hypothetical protein